MCPLTQDWDTIAAGLEPQLMAIGHPANYHLGRRSGFPGLPDNIVVFLRQNLDLTLPADHHHRHVLIIALAGGGRICVERHVHELLPGMARLIFPHQLHHYLDVRPPLRWLFITFEQDSSLAWSRLFDVPATVPTDAKCLIRMLIQLYGDGRPDAAQYLGMTTALLLRGLCDRAQTSTSGGSQSPARFDLLEQVNHVLYNRIGEPLGIVELAAELGLSPSHLRSQIKRSLGLSLGKYITRVRINHARVLLRDPCLRVGDVARQCGFGTVQSFCRAYRRLVGTVPRRAKSE